MKKVYRTDTTCQNCGHTVEAKYCSNCGQENIELHVPVWKFLTHLISDFFHFDTKFFRTILPLVFKPGALTIEYLKGRRRSYLDPLRMYIFISIIFFAFSSLSNDRVIKFRDEERGRDSVRVGDDHKRSGQGRLAEAFNVDSGDSRIAKKVESLVKEKYEKAGRDDNRFVEELSHKNSANLAKAMFILLPVFALILMIFYRKRHYVDHAVLALHNHSAAFILLTLVTLAGQWLPSWETSLRLLMLGYIIVYMVLSLKKVYGRSWTYTLFSFAAISFIYSLVYAAVFFLNLFVSLVMM